MKAHYVTIEATNEMILIKDIGPWDKYATVTNAAETVVAELAERLAGQRLEYIDSEGERSELVMKNGRFAGFKYVK